MSEGFQATEGSSNGKTHAIMRRAAGRWPQHVTALGL